MKKILIFTFLLSVGLTLSAQKAKKKSASKGPIREVKGSDYSPAKIDRSYAFKNAVKIDDYYYVISRTLENEPINLFFYSANKYVYGDFKIYKLDEKMNVKGVTTVPAEFEGRYVRPETIKKFGEDLVAFFYFNNPKTRRQYLFAQKIDIKGFKPIGSPYKIAEQIISKGERNIWCIFGINTSADSKMMLITADRSVVSRSRKEKKAAASQKNHTFTYWLIDTDFKLVNGAKNVKFGKGNTEIITQTFDNQGNMCFLGFEDEVKTSKKKKKKGDDDDDMEDDDDSKLVMKIIRPSGESQDLLFAQGQYFYSATMKLNPKTGNVAVVGLIGSGYYGAKGIFTQQVNLSSGEVLAENKYLFGSELVKEISELKPLTNREKKAKAKKEAKEAKKANNKRNDEEYFKKRKNAKKDPEHIDYLVRIGSVHYNDSNELVVTTQKYHFYTKTYTYTNANGSRVTYTVYYYVYGDILSFKFNENGNLDNFGYVFHQNVSTIYYGNTDYSSIYANDKLYVITRFSGGEITLDNKASELSELNELNSYSRGRYSRAQMMNVTENEIMYIMTSRKKLSFSLMCVEIE